MPANPPVQPTTTPSLQMTVAWDEYKILQDKIDRIGDFKFKIKGWSATLVFGFSLGAFTKHIPPAGYAPAVLMLCGLALLEYRQNVWERAFTERCISLETYRSGKCCGTRQPRLIASFGGQD